MRRMFQITPCWKGWRDVNRDAVAGDVHPDEEYARSNTAERPASEVRNGAVSRGYP
jgi:hypothetical protein